ncbi:hypothetical protein QAD02_002192 [Eretmocerus hayati]|uniref:Uncharacterized protein n=1 Tax=Eretmocerus hayati TaxID=131215 RepID=A0ACC2NJ63_9HYME|nr:hypothetical protein QAD02_002192 [Eretmocerus hayati]
MDDFENACALYNAFHIKMESDKKDYEFVAQSMRDEVDKENLILDMINDLGLVRTRRIFVKMDANSLPEFPTLSDQDLYRISLGSYRPKLAPSYYADHVKGKGKYEIQICREPESLDFEKYNIKVSEPLLLRVQLLSRHSKSVHHMAFILCDLQKSGSDSGIEYSCQCKAGTRTIGCCAPIMAVLWYLGNGRHQPEIKEPAKFLDDFFEDCITVESDISDGD